MNNLQHVRCFPLLSVLVAFWNVIRFSWLTGCRDKTRLISHQCIELNRELNNNFSYACLNRVIHFCVFTSLHVSLNKISNRVRDWVENLFSISSFNGVVKSLDCCHQSADESKEVLYYLHTETNLNYAIKSGIKCWDARMLRGRRVCLKIET